VCVCVLTAGGESSQPVEKSSVDTVPAAVTISHQVEAQLRLVVEVVSVIVLASYVEEEEEDFA